MEYELLHSNLNRHRERLVANVKKYKYIYGTSLLILCFIIILVPCLYAYVPQDEEDVSNCCSTEVVDPPQALVQPEDSVNVTGIITLKDAIDTGDLAILKYLVNRKHVDVNITDDTENTPLHWAARDGYLDIVKYLVDEKGANITQRNKFSNTPLHYAAIHDRLDVMKYLVDEKHADINIRGRYGNVPLNWAAYYGHLDIVKYLVDEQHASIYIANMNNNNAIHDAAMYGRLDILKYFVEEKDADINFKGEYGRTALDWAIQGGFSEAADYLRSKGGEETNHFRHRWHAF